MGFFKKIDDVVRGIANGATFGLMDNIDAAFDAGIERVVTLGKSGSYSSNLEAQHARDKEGGIIYQGSVVIGAAIPLVKFMKGSGVAATELSQTGITGSAKPFLEKFEMAERYMPKAIRDDPPSAAVKMALEQFGPRADALLTGNPGLAKAGAYAMSALPGGMISGMSLYQNFCKEPASPPPTPPSDKAPAAKRTVIY